MAVSGTRASPVPVTVHGVVGGQVSPLKTSKTKSGVRYFDGFFSDGKKMVRMISFNPKLLLLKLSSGGTEPGSILLAAENCVGTWLSL